MEELVKGLTGKKIDITCGTMAVYRGEVVEVRDGVVQLRDDDERTIFIAVKKISTVIEAADSSHRPGFIA